MDDLTIFLAENVEGYLFEDLETLKQATLGAGKTKGAVGYPLLLTAFAGIELLGNLVSVQSFNAFKGNDRFDEFWRDYLYASDADRAAAGSTLYKLARNGLAHMFVVKGDLAILKDLPEAHLVRIDGMIMVDACQLAIDLRSAYEEKIRPHAVMGAPLGATMATRLKEMYEAYGRQAAPLMANIKLPILPVDFNSVPSISGGKSVWALYSRTP